MAEPAVQLELLERKPDPPARDDPVAAVRAADHVIVFFSGGKDSLASVLHLLDLGVPRGRIELWHHDVDGREGSDLFDWPVTAAYCQAVADALGIPLYFSWKMGGIEGEMFREEARTRPMKFERPDGTVGQVGGTHGKKSTRRMWPAKSANLQTRWCSSYAKIMPGQAAIANQERFSGKRTVVITGERAEESANRASYDAFFPHKTDCRDGRKARHVDHWRPVLDWPEWKVWEIIERHRVRPHPCYILGFGRCSCAICIFGSPNQWATLKAIMPERIQRVHAVERTLDHTIDAELPVLDMAARGRPYPAALENPEMVEVALSDAYPYEAIVPAGEEWQLPAGAFGENDGPC